MVAGREINGLVNAYCKLRDRQTAVYARCAKTHGLTVNELFILDILWFSEGGCTQTVNAVIARFCRQGYVSCTEDAEDRRSKRIALTRKGKAYARKIIPPAADAENLAMADMTAAEARRLVKLTADFTDYMERRFAVIQ